MTKKNLYKILKVKRDATFEQIRAAYRKLAVQYHPDKNPGDDKAAAKFKEIAIAWAVLQDEETRAEYDRTGVIPDKKAQTDEDENAMVILSEMLKEVITQIISRGLKASERDIIADIRTGINKSKQPLIDELKGSKAAKEALQSTIGRFETNSESNPMEDIARSHIGECNRAIKFLEGKLESFDRALFILNKCKYRVNASGRGSFYFISSNTAAINFK